MSVQAGKPISVEAPTAKHLSERHVRGAACGVPGQSSGHVPMGTVVLGLSLKMAFFL